MKTIEDIKQAVAERLPTALMSLDKAQTPAGSHWLDIEYNHQRISVECKSASGFGLYIGEDAGYGERPSEVYRSSVALLKRIDMILAQGKPVITLKELRELAGKTQQEVSELAGQLQPSIEQLEGRGDRQLASIEKMVEALGGTLEIKAHFSEFDVSVDLSPTKPS